MAKIDDEEIDIPGDEDENVGDGIPKKKREKRRKSKEERAVERRVIFWTLLIILVITFGFWLMPSIESLVKGDLFKIDFGRKSSTQPNVQKIEKKNYMEITL